MADSVSRVIPPTSSNLINSIQSSINQVSQYVARLEVVISDHCQEVGDIEAGEEMIGMDRNVEDAGMFSDTTSFRGSVTSTVKSKSTLKTRTTTRSSSQRSTSSSPPCLRSGMRSGR